MSVRFRRESARRDTWVVFWPVAKALRHGGLGQSTHVSWSYGGSKSSFKNRFFAVRPENGNVIDSANTPTSVLVPLTRSFPSRPPAAVLSCRWLFASATPEVELLSYSRIWKSCRRPYLRRFLWLLQWSSQDNFPPHWRIPNMIFCGVFFEVQ